MFLGTSKRRRPYFPLIIRIKYGLIKSKFIKNMIIFASDKAHNSFHGSISPQIHGRDQIYQDARYRQRLCLYRLHESHP